MASSGSQRPACCDQLLENDRPVLLAAVKVLIKCAANILRNPTDPKFRRLPITNVNVQQCLLPAYGAIECLFEMGFVESTDHFRLPDTAPLSRVRDVHDALVELNRGSSGGPTTVDAGRGMNSAALVDSVVAANWLWKETEFYGRLRGSISHVRNFARSDLLAKARSHVPLELLTRQAKQRCMQLNLGDQFLPDQLLVQLLGWFKESFFRWLNSPDCCVCGAATEFAGTAVPLPEERAHLAGTVELFKCQAGCVAPTRFPRYNDPSRLLETRVGRCGEWASCFTVMCLAAGLEARYVVEWGDHVWTEVYSKAQRRWLHADPCENTCDEPLLYESGWGKKLSYVVAYSTDDIQDVTWRYSAKHGEVLSRRTACREAWLVQTIVELRRSVQQVLGSARVASLAERTALELVELMTEKNPAGRSLPGRTTGSEDWRRARGELGSAETISRSIVPTDSEIESGVLEVKYSSVRDEYVRTFDSGTVVSGWQSLVGEVTSMFRKEERDWRMVYLARSEGADVGQVVWKFELGSRDVCVDCVELEVESRCFETGVVRWSLTGTGGHLEGDEGHLEVIEPGGRRVFSSEFSGCTELRLRAELSGGQGRMAWQHAQLFRQSLTEQEHHQLCVSLRLRPKILK